MRTGNQLRLFSKDRRRQFRDVRRSHSRLGSMSQSQITKSVGKSRLERSVINQPDHSRISQFQNSQSRVLQQSKLNHTNQQSKSNKNLVCVCCYNKKQAQQKRNRRCKQQQKQQQQMMELKESLIQQNLHKQLIYENHVRHNLHEVNDFNKKLIERHQKQKLQEQRRKEQEDQEIRIKKMEDQRQKQNRMRNYIEQQNYLKQKYQEQMKIKQQKQNQMKKNNQIYDNYIVDSIIPPRQYSRSAVESIKAAYKQDLLKQIEQKQQQKRRQLEDRKGISPQKPINQFDLVTFAEKRNQQAKKYAQKLKQDNLKSINQKKNIQMQTKQQRQQERINQQKQRRQMINEQQIQRQKEEEMRRQKIQNYLYDLKGQIEANKKKRLQQLEWINQRKFAEPIIKVNPFRESDKESCQDCHKKYPKKLLSEFITIEE